MTKTLGVELLIWGLLLAGLGLLANETLPDYTRVAFLTSLAGGVLLMLEGVMALADNRKKVWSLLTLMVVCFILLSQAVSLWMPDTLPKGVSLSAIRTAAILISVMLAGSFVLLAQIAYTGVNPVGPATSQKPSTGTGNPHSPAGR